MTCMHEEGPMQRGNLAPFLFLLFVLPFVCFSILLERPGQSVCVRLMGLTRNDSYRGVGGTTG